LTLTVHLLLPVWAAPALANKIFTTCGVINDLNKLEFRLTRTMLTHELKNTLEERSSKFYSESCVWSLLYVNKSDDPCAWKVFSNSQLKGKDVGILHALKMWIYVFSPRI